MASKKKTKQTRKAAATASSRVLKNPNSTVAAKTAAASASHKPGERPGPERRRRVPPVERSRRMQRAHEGERRPEVHSRRRRERGKPSLLEGCTARRPRIRARGAIRLSDVTSAGRESKGVESHDELENALDRRWIASCGRVSSRVCAAIPEGQGSRRPTRLHPSGTQTGAEQIADGRPQSSDRASLRGSQPKELRSGGSTLDQVLRPGSNHGRLGDGSKPEGFSSGSAGPAGTRLPRDWQRATPARCPPCRIYSSAP